LRNKGSASLQIVPLFRNVVPVNREPEQDGTGGH